MRYSEEVRKADEYFDEIDSAHVGKEEMALVEQLIKNKTTDFKPEVFHDHYREALRELIDAKLENRAPEYEEEAPRGKVVNLMDALKKSLNVANDNKKRVIAKTKSAKIKRSSKKRKMVK